jgi:hypothetical protein
MPASFSNANPAITITEPPPMKLNGTYEVEVSGKSFAPAVDATTNIVYGAAGTAFVTISLCGYFKGVTPK